MNILLDETNTVEKFKATVEWMSEMYNKANQELFGGRLGDCNFKIENLGLHTLGRFKMCVPNGWLYVGKNTKRMYHPASFGAKIYINHDNFVELCKPTIIMNHIFSGTQESLYATLVHEMCHYYNYMNGYCPAQSHGRDFREIAMLVSYRSNGTLNIQRLATAEDMEGYQMDADMQAKKDKLAAAKQARREKQSIANNYYMIMYPGNVVRLLKIDNSRLLQEIVNIEHTRNHPVYHINDSAISNEFYNRGYKSVVRKYRFWALTTGDKTIQKALQSSTTEEI